MVDSTFFENNGPFTLQKIAAICEAEVKDASKAQMMIAGIATMKSATESEICFFYDKKAKENAAEIKAGACVTTEELAAFVPATTAVLTAKNPKLAFLKLNREFYSEKVRKPDIASSARIHPSAIIGQGTYIGDCVVIGENVHIGENCMIEPGVVIARGCQIGSNCRIGANASISYAVIGNGCYIYTGVRIGQDGFGFMMLNGKHERIPQLGRVVIGNDVEIGANTCIDRGALDDTVIGDGCRIDNLVQVAHNDKLGNGCVLVAQTGIAGSCTFGDYVVCGGQTGFADHLNVGSGVQVASQSGVMRDIKPGEVVMGSPAVKFNDYMRQVAYLQKITKR